MSTYDIVYICVRTYGNGKHMNRVHPVWFEYLSQAEEAANMLNKNDLDCCEPGSDRWIIMPVTKYTGPVWQSGGN